MALLPAPQSDNFSVSQNFGLSQVGIGVHQLGWHRYSGGKSEKQH